MQLTIFGANGPTGRLLTELALADGHDVVAVTRRPGRLPHRRRPARGRRRRRPRSGGGHRRHRRLRRRRLDARVCRSPSNPSPCTPTASPTSSPPCTRPASSDSSPSRRARWTPTPSRSAASSSRRCCSRTSSTSSAERSTTTCAGWKRSSRPAIWCGRSCARPGCARRTPCRDYVVAPDHVGHRFTTRIDLADCLLREAVEDLHPGAAIAVATPSANPSMLSLIWREGIRKQS